ncbi:MAG TPA: RluA family pseudouridine synthase [Candidatus Sulfomarinibacteraceae bacterium]|nr:RluA family pseudouridine synthase [Candidatus Sulfomarinibacteraceae bacterium]
MSRRLRFTVPDSLAGSRLDRCLAALEESWSRSRVRRLVDDGRVSHNGRPAKPATTVAAGDELVVDEPDVEPLDVVAEAIPLAVVFEDDEILVIDKPADLVIHPAAGNPSGTLVNALLHHCRDLSGIGGVARPGIVHRLDKDTTGLMVVAKTDRAHQALALAFRWRKVAKTYLAVCYGSPADDEGVVDAPIDRHPRERRQMAVVADGRPARTLYTVAERWQGVSLLHCRLVTGRTHQIRVHMAHVGHALVGDPLYAGRQWRNVPDARARAACRDFPRQALHAMRLAFAHPVSGEPLEFEAPPPADLQGLIELLRRAGG